MERGRAVITQSALEMRDALAEGGSLIGLDTGTKTIGVALCDREWRFATAGTTIRRTKFEIGRAHV